MNAQEGAIQPLQRTQTVSVVLLLHHSAKGERA